MEITGRVVGLNEQYFELLDDANQRHRFAVAMDAYLEAGELAKLREEGTRVVVVAHADMPGLPVAYRVFEAPAASAREVSSADILKPGTSP